MFNINGWELVVVAVLFIVLFGPERLPEAAVQLGRAVRDFRRATEAATEELTRELEAAAQETRAAEAQIRRAGADVRDALAGPAAPPPATPPDAPPPAAPAETPAGEAPVAGTPSGDGTPPEVPGP